MVAKCTGVANCCWTFRRGVDIRVLFGISDLGDQPLLTLKNPLFEYKTNVYLCYIYVYNKNSSLF